ncbi:YraN family protein [Leekyejoonella antrihumi]|uniref:UPF0102 protein FGL98_13345 n=1 Tax=Leekyejoonella antrihumi TaxID=1660198 RepID=A0A563E058_9MICO|nr:YraN family protein [Leekyejoonella antrihumi]TWP35562.1 YraN family protein [Leekyejoonella antrihumi]
MTDVSPPAAKEPGAERRRADPRHDLGRRGEETAARYLQSRGLVLIDRNWRCREGEIDIVALDEGADTLVVVEVKTRTSTRFGTPVEAVTPVKAARLRRLASCWLRDHPLGVARVRIDVIGVLAPRGGRPQITHISDVTS